MADNVKDNQNNKVPSDKVHESDEPEQNIAYSAEGAEIAQDGAEAAENFENLYEAALQEKEQLEVENALLQAKISSYFKERQFQVPEQFVKELGSDLEDSYHKVMREIRKTQEKQESLKEKSKEDFLELQQKLENEEKEVAFLNGQFSNLVKSVASKARYTTNGRNIPADVIGSFLKRLSNERKMKRKCCLEYIKQRSTLEQAQNRKQTIEGVDCPMKLYDYELMIYETNVCNTKLEQKRLEVGSLRKQCWNAVNAMTHLKHKLHFVRKNKHDAESKIKQLNQDVAKMTEGLLAIKTVHDTTIKTEKLKMKQKFYMLQNESLLDDYFLKKQICKELSEELQTLKERYAKVAKDMNRT